MSWGARAGSIVVVAFLALGLTFGASMALADTGDIVAPSDPENPTAESGWQAGTCFKDTPICSVDTPGQFFEQTAGHPQVGFTQIIVKTKAPGKTPVGELKTVRVDLPAGLSVNPQATPRCATVTEPASCPSDTQVGYSEVTASALGVPIPPAEGATKVPVFNMAPEDGRPALFGFELAGNNVYLRANVAWDGDFHEGFTIEVPEALPEALGELLGLLTGESGAILENRLVFDGRSGDGTFITTPSTCFGPAVPSSPFVHLYSTWLRADSYEQPNPDLPRRLLLLRVPHPARNRTEGMRLDPLRSVGRRQSGHRPDRLAERPVGRRPRAVRTAVGSRKRFPRGDQAGAVQRQAGGGDAAARDGAQPVGCRRRPADLRRCPVRSRHAQRSERLPGGVEDRQRLDRHAAVARRLAQRVGLRRQPGEPRSGLGQGVQDLRRSALAALRGLRAARRQGERRPGHGSADDHLRGPRSRQASAARRSRRACRRSPSARSRSTSTTASTPCSPARAHAGRTRRPRR